MSMQRVCCAGLVALMLLVSVPAWAIDADDQWGYGLYSAGATATPDVYSFDITLVLSSKDTIAPLIDFGPTGEDLSPAEQALFWDSLAFTGLHWQPDGNHLANSFDSGLSSVSHSQLLGWVPGSGPTLGQTGHDGFVGISVDGDGSVPGPPPYDIHADSLAELAQGIPLQKSSETIVHFHVDLFLPDGVGVQNALMGWTGQKKPDDGRGNPNSMFITAQNSTVLTPELPALGLMLPTLLGCAGFYWRRLRYGAK